MDGDVAYASCAGCSGGHLGGACADMGPTMPGVGVQDSFPPVVGAQAMEPCHDMCQ